MREANSGAYAVGYFESWNLESLLAVADAATRMRSPVILGFSGIHVPDIEQGNDDRLSVYAALGKAICRELPVASCLLFNESPHYDWVMRAIEVGFSLVMFTDENLDTRTQQNTVRRVAEKAHATGVAVEGEMMPLPGINGQLAVVPEDLRLTDPILAQSFIEHTGIDALAVNIGQAHIHGRRELSLNLSRLAEIRQAVSVPLVLHGATSIERGHLQQAIQLGIRKINVGSILKRAYFDAVQNHSAKVGTDYNPYDVVGSGLETDVLVAGRDAVRKTVEELMVLFGSVGKG
jgi:fructose-bisphosphate aldolase, class II